MESITFVPSHQNSLGIELELQILDPVSLDLCGRAEQLLEQLAGHTFADRIKPEMTQAMIELNSSVHEHPAGLLAEMREMRDLLCDAADAVGVRIAGGGAHPFMNWQDGAIFDSPRFHYLAQTYGYLARKFAVFGQHIHIGVAHGNAACELIHRLSPYVPHLIALSASSPFHEGVDTLFSCSRLNALHSFPMSGRMPSELLTWRQFATHFAHLRKTGLVDTLKDLYWDIRPKPEFGTVEIRVCDTPLSIERACQIAAFAQALSIAVQRQPAPSPEFWLAYDSNRFQAARFGLQAAYVSPAGERVRLIDHLRQTFDRLMPIADELGTADMVGALCTQALTHGNDADWMRERHGALGSLPELVHAAAERWRGSALPTTAASATGRRRVRASSEPIHDALQAPPVALRRLPTSLH